MTRARFVLASLLWGFVCVSSAQGQAASGDDAEQSRPAFRKSVTNEPDLAQKRVALASVGRADSAAVAEAMIDAYVRLEKHADSIRARRKKEQAKAFAPLIADWLEIAEAAEVAAEAEGAPPRLSNRRRTVPKIRGKLLFDNAKRRQRERIISRSYAGDDVADTPDEVGTALVFRTEWKVTGTYTSKTDGSQGGDAHQAKVTVTLIDKIDGTVRGRRLFRGSMPAKTTRGHGDTWGRLPRDQICGWLRRLPRE